MGPVGLFGVKKSNVHVHRVTFILPRDELTTNTIGALYATKEHTGYILYIHSIWSIHMYAVQNPENVTNQSETAPYKASKETLNLF